MITLAVLGIVGCLCLSFICVAAAGLVIFQSYQQINAQQVEPHTDQLDEVIPSPRPRSSPTAEPERMPVPTQTPNTSAPALEDSALETQRTLREEIVPINDPIELAERLKGLSDIQPTLPPPAVPLQIGDQQQFWVTNGDTDEKRQTTASLRYMNEHLYFWIEIGVPYNSGDMQRLADEFSNKIYPTNREFFGSEWNPGIDSDPRLHVLYVTGVGSSVAGYFSSADEFPPEAMEFSNAREMFVLSADNVSLSEPYIYGTMAHEFQHMIHFYTDRNDESWINEGFSVLAELLNGYDVGGFDYLFMLDPDLALTHWPGPGQSGPNYGSSFLFVTYFLNRYGEDATKALVASPLNGMESIDAVLLQLGELDPNTGLPFTADDFYADWAVANYLDDPIYDGGRFYYGNYPSAPKASPTEAFASCPVEAQSRTVNQYGTDYIRIACRGDYTLTFQGSTQVPLLPVDSASGEYAFWSNRGDESNMYMERVFDFSQVSGPIELSYRTWYDLEEDYDYAYVLASEDGESWDILRTPTGTGDNPNGNNYGWAYNGSTGANWRTETVDLSPYAGRQIWLRFEYVTDTAVNHEGFLVDDIAIEAVDYFSDFETDDGGWTSEGFVRVTNRLPQTFQVSAILLGDETQVVSIALDERQWGSLDFTIGDGVSEVILVVGGTTRITTQEAQYEFEIR